MWDYFIVITRGAFHEGNSRIFIHLHTSTHRIQGKDAEGKELPPGFREPMRFKPTEVTEEYVRERRTGDLNVADCVYVDKKLAGDDAGKMAAVADAEALFKRFVYVFFFMIVALCVKLPYNGGKWIVILAGNGGNL